MNYRIGIYLTLIVVGLVVLAWPEQNDLMMIQFSKAHGPSSLDLSGLALIFLGYIPLIIPVFTKFPAIRQQAGHSFARLLVVIAMAGSFLIALALIMELEILLWVAVAFSTMAQAVLIYFASSNSQNPSPGKS